MKRLLEARGKIANSPREAFRMSALVRGPHVNGVEHGVKGFIKDPEIWFDFLKKRNITLHTYEEKEAKEVISVFSDFSSEIHAFLKNIGA